MLIAGKDRPIDHNDPQFRYSRRKKDREIVVLISVHLVSVLLISSRYYFENL